MNKITNVGICCLRCLQLDEIYMESKMSDNFYLLCVDDEVMNQEILIDLLEDDFELAVVDDGQQCLDNVAKRRPDLILLDVNMPVLNGLDTCKKLRADINYQDIPIIFVSALAIPEERTAGYEAGGDDYITKPFEHDELVARINLIIQQRKA